MQCLIYGEQQQHSSDEAAWCQQRQQCKGKGRKVWWCAGGAKPKGAKRRTNCMGKVCMKEEMEEKEIKRKGV